MMEKWNGKKLADYMISKHGTTNPMVLANIYGFNVTVCSTDLFQASYSIDDYGNKEILINESVPPIQIPFYIGQQLALFLLRNPSEIERA